MKNIRPYLTSNPQWKFKFKHSIASRFVFIKLNHTWIITFKLKESSQLQLIVNAYRVKNLNDETDLGN